MKQTPDFAIPTTSDYAVSVGGQPAAVYAMPTRYGQTLENNKPVSVYDGAPLRRPMYFACADIGGTTTLTVEIGFLPVEEIRSVTAHPLSRGIEVRREGARVTFEVDRPGTVTLLVNGDHRDHPQSDDRLVVSPLIPAEWDHFCLDRVCYHGHDLTVLYDRTGEKYGRGKGLRLYCDGREVAECESLSRLTADLASCNDHRKEES